MQPKSNTTYIAKHKPSGETWVILGISKDRNQVCADGWPPTVGRFSDCKNFRQRRERTIAETDHMNKNFGENWN